MNKLRTLLCTVKTAAKTSKGIARAYIKKFGAPRASDWSAGGSGTMRDLDCVEAVHGLWRLTATSIVDGKPAGKIYGPHFIVRRP